MGMDRHSRETNIDSCLAIGVDQNWDDPSFDSPVYG